jgi:nucleotide-binding universal stress UspA family protein
MGENPMYKTIYVPVDNSDYSNQAIASAVRLGKAFESKLVGCHVYAAQMHDYRFRQMEYTLPEEYLEETELERQRKIHDSLITMGLELISDSYLDNMKRLCADEGLPFEPKMMDGKHHVEIVKDIKTSDYDLTVLGVMGIGRARDSQIGSVCERVARTSDRDVLVVKRLPGEGETGERDTILVGIDGSPQSFGALMTAIELAGRFGKKVEAIAVYDPYLHYSVFNGVVNVLTEKAAKVFRFEEQNQLHEEIIDTGLAQIYQSHLDVAERIAADQGVELTKTLLDGKAFQKVLDQVRKTDPWLLVIGRIGVHSAEGEPGLGSNTENLLRLCPCDLLLTTRLEYPELDVRAEESIRWTPEAEERMKRVPRPVRGVARTAIYRLAVEKGHSVISSAVLDEAMDRFMPKSAAAQTARLAEAMAFERARTQPTSICMKCGVTARDANPVKCSVCGAESFELITPELIEKIAGREGGAAEEATYDGRKLSWTQDAKRALWTLKDAYRRRRCKARVEKSARMKKLPTVTLEFARAIIEEETGESLVLPEQQEREAAPQASEGGNGEARLIARDAKKNPLFSSLDWDDAAVERIFRVPVGYMRKRTQDRAESLAAERGAGRIDLALVEDGIEVGRQMMEEMLGSHPPSASPEPERKRSNGKNGRGNGSSGYLNEVSLMSAMCAKRKPTRDES